MSQAEPVRFVIAPDALAGMHDALLDALEQLERSEAQNDERVFWHALSSLEGILEWMRVQLEDLEAIRGKENGEAQVRDEPGAQARLGPQRLLGDSG